MAIANEYLETRVSTAPRHMLHLMVVEGAIRFAKMGIQAIAAQDYETSHFALVRSRACVTEMILALKPEGNPELIERLKGLFLFVHQAIAAAELKRDVIGLRDALGILEMHRETWLQLIETLPPEPSTDQFRSERTEFTQSSWLT